MGKRSSIEREGLQLTTPMLSAMGCAPLPIEGALGEKDFWPTPREAVLPLLPHVSKKFAFYEPCAGDGALIHHLESFGHECSGASDIAPRAPHIEQIDAMDISLEPASDCFADGHRYFITNPPWSRSILHPIIMHLSEMRPTWLLFDADWMHTIQAAPYLSACRKIISVGRVKWVPESDNTGMDNAAWYLFDQNTQGLPQFIGRAV